MKKKQIILIIVVVLILIALISIFIYNKVIEEGKKYTVEKIDQYHYFVLKQEGNYGVMDDKGNIIIEPEYTEVKIPNPGKAVFICYQEQDTQVLNEGKETIFTQYSKIEPIRLKNITSDLMYEKSILKYEKEGKYGLIDLQGKEIAKPVYDEIDSLPYKEGELLVKQNDQYGVINMKGNQLIDIAYDKIVVDEYYSDEDHYQHAGYIVSVKTQEGYRYGYLDYRGKEIYQPEYNDLVRVTEFQAKEDFYLITAKNGQYGIRKNKEELVKNEYQSIRYDANNQVFVVEKSKKYGIVNLEGKLIVPVQYNQIDITGIYLYAENEQGTTVYNNNGTQANIDANVAILDTNNEKYRIRINNENGTQYGVINKEGKQLIEEKYHYIEYLYENYFIASNENGKLGILDDRGNEKIEMTKDSLQKVQNTDLIQTTIAEDKMTQVYDKNMQKICEMQNAIIITENDKIKIYNETETKYFDENGKELKNTDVYPEHSLFVVTNDNQYGFMDKQGNIVVSEQYDKAYEFNDYGFAAVKKDGKWGVLNEQGKEVIAPIYEFENQVGPFFIGKYYRVTYGFGEIYYTDLK